MKTFIFILFLAVPFTGDSQTSQWNVISLKEYIDQKFESMQLAITKAEESTEKRFEGVNEFRNTLADQQRTFIPRAEYEAGHISLTNQVLDLKAQIDKINNIKQGGNAVWFYILSALSFIISIISIRDRIIERTNKK